MKQRHKAIGIVMLVTSLTACSGKTAPPQITYDFTPAFELAPDAKPIKIVTVPEPLPLPGQLKLRPGVMLEVAGGEALKPQARVASANKAARVEPDRDQYLNAVQVYPFTEGALYQLYASPGKVTDITLQAGVDLSRYCAAPGSHLSGDLFESQGAFPS